MNTTEFEDRELAEEYEEDATRVREASANVKGYLIDQCGFEDDE